MIIGVVSFTTKSEKTFRCKEFTVAMKTVKNTSSHELTHHLSFVEEIVRIPRDNIQVMAPAIDHNDRCEEAE